MNKVQSTHKNKFKVGYLSGGPRVSTRPEAIESGPRAHVIGIINAFKHYGFNVKQYIVGDCVPTYWVKSNSISRRDKNIFKLIIIDMVRIGFGLVNVIKTYNEVGGNTDIVYERFALFQSLGYLFKKRGIPWIVETNAVLSNEAKFVRNSVFFYKLAMYHEKWVYNQCDLLVCISPVLKKAISRKFQIPYEKILVVPNAVDIERFDLRNQFPIRFYDSFTIGFVGRLYKWQNLDLLIKVINKLRSQGIPLSLVIVGDGDEKESLITLVNKLRLEPFVTFTGYIGWEEIPRYIAGFDICYSGHSLMDEKIYLSPLKVYEYMAMARPVIASRSSFMDNLIVHRKNGFLFGPQNKEELSSILKEAYKNREMLKKIGQSGRFEVIKYHSWNSRIKLILNHPLVKNLQSFSE
ncbi:MAG: glycosyltransferase family 4 protein [Actinobacteria bacterium]|nr:glycosyltransferase family 4 protein [Actinomycetota bacterium]